MVIGLISDTHGLVRPEIFAALDGVEVILHAGDVGGGAVLTELSAIAPVQAVAARRVTRLPARQCLPCSRVPPRYSLR